VWAAAHLEHVGGEARRLLTSATSAQKASASPRVATGSFKPEDY
jgi:hypothetical protein